MCASRLTKCELRMALKKPLLIEPRCLQQAAARDPHDRSIRVVPTIFEVLSNEDDVSALNADEDENEEDENADWAVNEDDDDEEDEDD